MDFFLSFTEKKYYYILSTSHIRSFCFGVVTLLGVLTDRATNLCEGLREGLFLSRAAVLSHV